jgi:hypothetical protein
MAHSRLFRIFYSTFFTLLNIVTLGLLLITPADAINQALSNNQLYNVFVIAGGYLLTLILTIIIYASRLYTNRTVIAGIPKTWIPVEKGDVRKSVRKMIMESLSRSAVIAWNARPRVLDHATKSPQDVQVQVANIHSFQTTGTTIKYHKLLHRKRVPTEKNERDISLPPHPPVWGEIAHEGWSPPSSPDLPNLQYVTVIFELPHLIEAKAVSLAPPDATSTTNPPMPDLRAVELLQRPASMGLRDYIGHLTTLGILPASKPEIITTFLSSYEIARFSPTPRTEKQFRDLMKLFADILRSMTPLDPAILDSLPEPESDIDADASSTTTSEGVPSEPPRSRSRSRSVASSRPPSSRSGSEGTIRTAPSRRHAPMRSATFPLTLSAAGPSTPKIRKKRDRAQTRGTVLERSPSLHSFAQTRRPYDISQASSHSSLVRTASGSGESVIKLSKTDRPGDLPYTIRVDR